MRKFIAAAALSLLAGCAPQTIMSSKEQVVIDAQSPGAAVAHAREECSSYSRKPYYVRSNYRTYWFLCLPPNMKTRGAKPAPRHEEARSAEPARTAHVRPPPPPPVYTAPPIAGPGAGGANIGPYATGVARAPGGYAMALPRMPPGRNLVPLQFLPQQGQPAPYPGQTAMAQFPGAQVMPGGMVMVPPAATGPPQQFGGFTQRPQAVAPAPPQQIVRETVVITEPAVADGRYWIQIGATRSKRQAAALGRRFARGNSDLIGSRRIVVRQSQVRGKGTYYRSHLGPYASASSARTTCGTLKRRKQECFVIRR